MKTRTDFGLVRGLLAAVVFAALGILALNGNLQGVSAARASDPVNPSPTEVHNGDQGGGGFTAEDFNNAFPIYAPSMKASLFVDCVDNPYFPLVPGTVYHLEEHTSDGVQTETTTVTNETKEILGIRATVVHDTVEEKGEILEDTFDWYAQDDRGNVWYLGEDTKEYENGKVVSTEGSWEAGVDGAVAGIIMPGDPRPGDFYYQEFLKGEAEDQGAIISLSDPVKVPQGTYDKTIHTAEYNPLDKELENKWYAPGVGVVKEIVVGEDDTTELVRITQDSRFTEPGKNGSTCGAGE